MNPDLADLVFDPTHACWKLRYPDSSSHCNFSRTATSLDRIRQGLHLDCTMLRSL